MGSMIWLNYSDDLHVELLQGKEEGKDVRGYEERVRLIQAMKPGDPEREKQAADVFDRVSSLPVESDFRYIEPSDITEIKNTRPERGKNVKPDIPDMSGDMLYDKVYGAWLGRCAGCLLGKPIEGWRRDRITGLLKETGNYPVKYYISSAISDDLRKRYNIADECYNYGNRTISWINNVRHMPEDDDINYTVIGLKILERYGPGFTPDNVAESWLLDLPILHVCTAERIAYRNLINLVFPPLSAGYRNPYREWIGAQIRADFYGYITPGNPQLGAEMAWRDASISHVKNGIYGEMFIAAMLSAAAAVNDAEKLIENGLSQIPEKSRLSDGIRKTLSWKREGIGWEQAIDRIHELYDEKIQHYWCHTISNAMIVCIGLLFGGMDLEKSIGIAVSAAFDTDCNGATVGSIIGMVLGAKALPDKWINPLNDQLASGVSGFSSVKISDMAKRTVEIIKRSEKILMQIILLP
ncbi:MAG: ADP-ribosylglycohydrolase family protein [Clostridiaceae bacterium]